MKECRHCKHRRQAFRNNVAFECHKNPPQIYYEIPIVVPTAMGVDEEIRALRFSAAISTGLGV